MRQNEGTSCATVDVTQVHLRFAPWEFAVANVLAPSSFVASRGFNALRRYVVPHPVSSGTWSASQVHQRGGFDEVRPWM